MTIDPTVIPGLLLLAVELLVLAAFGYIVTRVALRQSDDRLALAQGLVIGPALWGLLVNFLLHLLPGSTAISVGWIAVLTLSISLGWRHPKQISLPIRTAVGLALAGSLIFSTSLAARQLWGITEPSTHLGLAARVQSGAWPLVFPWNPDQPFIYHYGYDLLVGLLTPSRGPNLAFTTELFDAYLWTSFALVVITILMKRAGWLSLLVLLPLLLTAGAWTMLIESTELDLLELPVPTGIPTAGIRESLARIYWPDVSLNWKQASQASPPNIWKPVIVISYALTLVVLTHATDRRYRSWPKATALAAIIGFMGLLSEEIALVVLALWVGLETLDSLPTIAPRISAARFTRLFRRRESGSEHRHSPPERVPPEPQSVNTSHLPIGAPEVNVAPLSFVIHRLYGPALAVILLAIGGGPISAFITGSAASGLYLEWPEDLNRRQPLGSLVSMLYGGVGVLGLGAVPAAVLALLLRGKQRIVLSLAVGSMAFFFVSLTLNYTPAPHDLFRIDGHARNYALLAFLLAVAAYLANLRNRWRYVTGLLLFVLVTWPSSMGPLRMLALEVGQGIELSNARSEVSRSTPAEHLNSTALNLGRYSRPKPLSGAVERFIRDQTPIDSRILSPKWNLITESTGRLNAAGFVRFSHATSASGPEYADAISFLDPEALRRMGITHVHATDTWIGQLPDRAQRWLEDPQLFELLVRGEDDRLYRVLPTLLEFNPMPNPRSFEALRLTIPASSAVRVLGLTAIDSMRIASTLPHTRLLGRFPRGDIHLRSEIVSHPPDSAPADFVIVPRDRPSPYGLRTVRPIWWNKFAIAYETKPSSIPTVDSPPQPEAQFTVRLSEIQQTNSHIAFSATFTDHAPSAWTGQDWLLISGRDLPWALPTEDNGITVASLAWFAGQIAPGGETTHVYEYDARQNRLAVQNPDGALAPIQSSGDRLTPGVYVLAVRLRSDHLQAAIIPVMRIAIMESGASAHTLYAGEHSTQINPCPERLKDTRSCRRIALKS